MTHGSPAPPPPPTPFEQAVSDAADEIIGEGKTGYAWTPVDALLHETLGIAKTRCKKATGSGRAANVLTESNDKDIDLYVVFVGDPYTREQFRKVAEDRIARFPNVKTVAVADRTDGVWRVKEIIERSVVGLAENVRNEFPLVGGDDIHLVEAHFPDDGGGKAVVPDADAEVFATASSKRKANLQDLDDLFKKFRDTAAGAAIRMDVTVAADVLATVLSSQLVLFAGPSGTGKSTIARLCESFFASPDLRGILESRRQLIGPEDVVGYYSPITSHFATTSETMILLELHEACVAAVMDDPESASSPFLLVEEMNLSYIEGYLSPVVHGLSSPSVSHINWSLHARPNGASDPDETIVVPSSVLLGPFPRFFGTINVDATAPAPARKVTARASVILLEPERAIKPAASAATLATPHSVTAESVAADGRSWIGDPATARLAAGAPTIEELIAELEKLMIVISSGESHVGLSYRDLERSTNYMTYFTSLCEAVAMDGADTATIKRLAAENAVLHIVLPTLLPESFAPVVGRLLDGSTGLVEAASVDTELGGLLRPRLESIAARSAGSLFGEAIDFWASLS